MQYTIRNIPKQVDRALRAKAKAEGKSVNQAVVDALRQALGLADEPKKRRDLSDLAGTMSPEDARAIEDFVAWADEADLKSRRGND